jgi:hypothetical protein
MLLLTIFLAVFSMSLPVPQARAGCVCYQDYVSPLDIFHPGGHPRSFVHQEPYLYVVHEGNGLVILDTSDPAHLEEIGSLSLPASPRGIDVQGGLAYITSVHSDAVQLADVSDPFAPELLGSVTLPAGPETVAAAGAYGYVPAWDYGEDDHGLYVVDASDPQAPVVVNRVELGSYPRNVILSETQDYAYVLDFQGLWVVDLSIPDAPIPTGFVTIPGEVAHLGVRGDHVYVVSSASEYPPDGDGLYMVNVSDPKDPWIEGEYTPEGTPNYGVALWEHYAIVGTYGCGFAFIDISDPANMQVRGHVGIQRSPGNLIVVGSTLFARSYSIGSYELHEPLVAEPVASVAGTYRARTLASQGDYAYTIRNGGEDFCVVDLSDPESPDIVGIEHLDLDMGGVIALTEGPTKNRYAYVGEGGDHDGFHVLDITNPQAPERVGSFPLDHSPSDLEVEGNYLYVMAGHLGLMTYDISNPVEPEYISSLGFGYSASIVEAVGSTLYVGRRVQHHTGLFVIDASDPADLQIVGESPAPTLPCDFEIIGSLLYIADGWGGLLIMDVGDPQNPEVMSRKMTATMAQALAIEGDYVYLADTNDHSGLQVIDVSDPLLPLLAGYYPCNFPCDLRIINGHALVATYNDDLEVAPLECDFARIPPTFETVSPTVNLFLSGNPGLNGASVQLVTPVQGRARLAVYDVRGRIVDQLFEGWLPAGVHGFHWDGCGHEGGPVPAGVYYVRHMSGRSTVSTPVVLVR